MRCSRRSRRSTKQHCSGADAISRRRTGIPAWAAAAGHYLFKHALVQDTAYQSLLKSKRQQIHQQIAQVLEERFPETAETQPELLAHHYTEAGLIAAGHSLLAEGRPESCRPFSLYGGHSHLTKGLELLKTLPDTPERLQQELTLQNRPGLAFMATKSYAAPEVGKAYTRARELCRQIGETPQLCSGALGLVDLSSCARRIADGTRAGGATAPA